jgi:hypothetical protein
MSATREPIIVTISQCKITTVVLDLHWIHDPKIVLLSEKFPVLGPLVYLLVCAEIGKAGGFLLSQMLPAVAHASRLMLEDVEKVVAECSELNLFTASPHGISSFRVQKEIEKTVRMRLCAERSQVIVFPWTNLSTAPQGIPRVPPRVPLGDPPTKKRKEEKREEEKREEETPQGAKFRINLPPALDTPEVRKGFQLWARKCRQNGRPLDEIRVESILCQFGNRPRELARALVYSSGLSKCMNLVEPSGPPSESPPNRFPGVTNPVERRLLEQALKEGKKV